MLLFLLTASIVKAATTLVSNPAELTVAIKNAKPGDMILLAKGEWKNANLLFEANGIAGKSITISVEEKGATQLTGNSSLKFAGNYLVADGLFFTNGYAETGAVVEFRKNDKTLANNCRLTNCVFENYSKPDRFATDSWLILWGKNNRIDHCTIGDKLNAGTTLIVNLDDERSQQNFHSIDSNYFHLHSPLGSNGGETIRVGVSRYSLTSSNTIITHNYFEKCSGEVEIISVKSADNKVMQNTFFECEGGLVLRHGARNLVDGNLFICNNKQYTGGIRVINPGHTITNNLVLNSAGVRFRSALGVLNGVPNSQLNRYYQVKDANINHNSFINCAAIVFGAGKDNERTSSPQNVTFANNFISPSQKVLYEDLNKDGGIIFKNNFSERPLSAMPKGFTPVKTKMIDWHGLHFEYPTEPVAGADLRKVGFVEKNAVGAEWYHPTDNVEHPGKEIK
ncbi:MAG: polysaccharide lyase 6 family protein, partial [Ginsengibacter sp.]